MSAISVRWWRCTVVPLAVGATAWCQSAVADKPAEVNARVSQNIKDCKDQYQKRSEDSKLTREERAQMARLYVSCLKDRRAEHAIHDSGVPVQDKYEVELTQATLDSKVADANNQFLGMSWGVGIGISKTRSSTAIESAAIVNGVVTVTSDKRLQSRVFLESHYYFDGWCSGKDKVVKQGCGPFMAVATSANDVAGVGFGFMFGWKPKAEEKDGFSVGIGMILDNKVKNLASGFTPGSPPPPGATTVLTEEKARWSNMLFVTRTF
jgi:hypothetical protein